MVKDYCESFGHGTSYSVFMGQEAGSTTVKVKALIIPDWRAVRVMLETIELYFQELLGI